MGIRDPESSYTGGDEFHQWRRVTIVGVGNWMLGHDRIGPQVLSAIDGRYGNDIELYDTGTNGLSLLDTLHAQDLLIIIDACLGAGPPGLVEVVDPHPHSTLIRETSVHQIGPREALVIGHHLYPERMPKRVLLVMVNTNGLDEAGEFAACREVIQVLDEHIAAWQIADVQPGKEGNHGEQRATS